MGTKLKKILIERKLEIGIWILAVSASVAIFFVRYFYISADGYVYPEKTEFYGPMKVSASLLALLLGGLLIVYGFYKKKNPGPAKERMTCSRADRIPLEIVVLLLTAGLAVIVKNLQMLFTLEGYYHEWNRNLEYWGQGLRYGLLMGIVFSAVYGSLILLGRKVTLGLLWETSFIRREICSYRNRTPLEIQLWNRKRGFLAGEIFLLILMLAASFSRTQIGEFPWLELIWGSIMLLLFFKCTFSENLTRDTGLLCEMVRKISLGNAQELPELSKNSMLEETAAQIGHMKEIAEQSARKQMQAERLKVELITNVSHDLKTPLTSLISYTELLKKEELSEAARDYVEAMEGKGEQLKQMIQDLFELSKATSGTEQLHMEALDMEKLLIQILGDMEDSIRSSGMEIRTEFGEEALLFLGDNGKMYRTVQNLLENALKYSLHDTRIYIEAKRCQDRIRLVIKNIAGYEMDFQPEEIMERFARGDKARTTKGHGLGLAIASSFVKNMNGRLWVETDGDLFKVLAEFPALPPCETEKSL